MDIDASHEAVGGKWPGSVSPHPGCAIMMRNIHSRGTFRPNHSNGMPAVPQFTEPRKWYFVVDCSVCGKPVPLAEAPSPDEKPDPLEYRTIANLTCPHCGYVGTYVPRRMSRRLVEHTPGDRFQAPILYVLAGIAALSFLAAVLFVMRTYR